MIFIAVNAKADINSIIASFVIPGADSPVVSYVSPSTGVGTFSQDYIEVNITASDNDGIANITIYLYNSSKDLINSSNASSSNLFVNFTNLNDGVYYVNSTAYDTVGTNGSSSTRQIILDTVNPALQISSPQNTTYTYSNILVNFTAIDDNLDSLWYYNTTANITYTTPSYTTLADGTYNFIFYANDSAGNFNYSSVTFTVLAEETRLILDYQNYLTGNIKEVCFKFYDGTLCLNSSGIVS